MARSATQVNAHAKSPEHLRPIFKQWQKCSLVQVESNPDLLDSAAIDSDDRVRPWIYNGTEQDDLSKIFAEFLRQNAVDLLDGRPQMFEVRALPGLVICPSLLPISVQISMLDKLLHRDLSNPKHYTNIHFHHDMPDGLLQNAPTDTQLIAPSLYSYNVDFTLCPKDATEHKPITMAQVLSKKLRWATFGGQYDWTNKVYPSEKPPPFPQDIAALVRGLFPSIEPQAAILNFYSPGDTLSLHRDVSEQCDRDLASISIGCDALFMAANLDGSAVVTIRLRSGDAVLMSGESRFAWHAVPKVLAGTCDPAIQDWPAVGENVERYRHWRGWLAAKRINLNVRQMRDEPYDYSDETLI